MSPTHACLRFSVNALPGGYLVGANEESRYKEFGGTHDQAVVTSRTHLRQLMVDRLDQWLANTFPVVPSPATLLEVSA